MIDINVETLVSGTVMVGIVVILILLLVTKFDGFSSMWQQDGVRSILHGGRLGLYKRSVQGGMFHQFRRWEKIFILHWN